jgi:hypothetical protein
MKILANGKGILEQEPDYYGPKSFHDEAFSKFPELLGDLDESSGLHVLVASLATAGRSAMETGNASFLDRLFTFSESVLLREKLHPEIRNALLISFLVPEDFERSEAGRKVWARLPERTKHVLQQAI